MRTPILVQLCMACSCLMNSLAVGQGIPRCEVIPEAGHRVAFQVDGIERFAWYYGDDYPRPFLYPLLGPSGVSLTRMGHPGAPDHDHHQSVWFAHHDVAGQSFWANGKETRITQKQWLAYEDGDSRCTMACLLGWNDAQNRELLEQELVIELIPGKQGQYEVEIQATFRAGESQDEVRLGKTNFGFLAVRVSKSLSERFGGGKLTNSQGLESEKQIFAKHAQWVDYSGSVYQVQENGYRAAVTEGITFMEHPSNPTAPNAWHVRADGWMGSSPSMEREIVITPKQPLQLRYCLWVHRGGCDPVGIQTVFDAFSKRESFHVGPASASHVRHQISRRPPAE